MQRTKRHYQGTVPTGKKIADLLPEILSAIPKSGGEAKEALFQYWFFLVGEKMSKFTRPVSFMNGNLTIKVKSATLYALMCQHEKERLLKALQAKFPVQDLVFRVG